MEKLNGIKGYGLKFLNALTSKSHYKKLGILSNEQTSRNNQGAEGRQEEVNMEKVSCFNCIYHAMCKAKEATKEIPFNTLSVNYPENHKKLYEAIATICGQYKGDLNGNI